MAYAQRTIRHGTLVASTVATVNLTGDHQRVTVINRSGAADIFFTVDGSTPTVAGNDCYVAARRAGLAVTVPSRGSGDTVVKLISTGTEAYTVTGDD